MEPTFVHLRVHSEFSLTDGLVRVGPLMKSVAAAGMPAVAVTDRNNFFGLIKAYKAAEREGVKLIIGADFEILEEDERRHQVTFLAQSTEGYRNLTVLISQAYQEGQILGRPLLRRDWIQEKSQGLIALSGGRNGEVGQHLVAGRPQEAVTALQWWMSLFPDRYYLELQRTGRENEEDYLPRQLSWPPRKTVPLLRLMKFVFSRRMNTTHTKREYVLVMAERLTTLAARVISLSSSTFVRLKRWLPYLKIFPRRLKTRFILRRDVRLKSSWAKLTCRTFQRLRG